MYMNVQEHIKELLGEILCRALADETKAFALSPANGVTALDIAQLAIACERHFGFALHDEKIAKWETLRDAASHIGELLDEGQGLQTTYSEEERTPWHYE